jgi:hypothetical protein
MTSRNQREGRYAGQVLTFHMRSRIARRVSTWNAEQALIDHSDRQVQRLRNRRVRIEAATLAVLPNDRSQG